MIRLLAGLFTLALMALLGLAVLLFTAIDTKPLVERGETVSTDAIDQARKLLLANDPRRLREGEERSALIPATLLDEGVNYVATQLLHGRGALSLQEKSAEIRLSLPLPGTPGYLNLRATVPEAAGEPRIAALSVGDVPIPAVFAEQTLDLALTSLGYGQQWRMARAAVRELAFDPARGMVDVRYAWDPALLDSARAAALDPADVDRIREAQAAFATLLEGKQRGDRVTLAEVLAPLMSGNGQGREQRRAALLVLASSLAGGNLAAIVPEAASWPRPQRVAITLRGRHDSAQHFVVSAALAAWAGEPVATAIGLYKELEDARRGSGFSFADLAADRAGTRFGELVAADAARLDEVLAGTPGDADLLPPLDGLPEFLPEAEFRRRYGGPGEPAYEKVADEIERRLSALALYR
ncbi:MAG: hypothetical protein IPO20_19285 [Gammaproteobacteria bacterium]|nr:hypothetical protein [Gammaproteobacteria bacterium]